MNGRHGDATRRRDSAFLTEGERRRGKAERSMGQSGLTERRRDHSSPYSDIITEENDVCVSASVVVVVQ